MPSKITRREFLKLLSLAALTPAAQRLPNDLGRAKPHEQTLPNVLVLVFDAFSARHVSVYGYPRQTTPNLERFAERAIVYHHHYAAANFTTPGTASLLTGTYPWSHRAFNTRGTVIPDYVKKNLFTALDGSSYYRAAYSHNMYVALLFNQFHTAIDFLKPSEDLFLANEVLLDDLLRKDENVALLSEDIIFPRDERLPSSLFLSLVDQWRRFLLLRGIENRRTADYPLGFPMVDEDFHPFLLEDSTDWLIGQLLSMPRPFFMYYHALPPHEPYRPRREFNGLFEDGWEPVSKPEHIFSQFLPQSSLNQRRLAYDRYVANVDTEFGRIFEALQQHGMLDNTLVILTSDHGQMFERGIHGHITPTLYHPLLHIPLLISLPGQAQRQDIRVGTSSVDILPTISHLTRRPLPAWTEGELLPPFNENSSADRSIYALETKTSFKFRPLIAGTVALMKGPYKLMRYFGFRDYHDIYEMYDLDGDPEELDDIYPAQVRGVKQMRSEILRMLEKVDQPFL